MPPDLSPLQWSVALGVAALIGSAKTGIPGLGTFVVPLAALAFGARTSVGLLLPLMLFADLFGMAWYRKHADPRVLRALTPWIGLGLVVGAGALYWSGMGPRGQTVTDKLIGLIVLGLVGAALVRHKLEKHVHPESALSAGVIGSLTGFASTSANVAGAITSIYFTALEMAKERFMGTNAVLYFVLNLAKLVLYAAMSLLDPAHALFSAESLWINLWVAPAIVVGALVGRVVLRKLPQQVFENVMLALAALASIKLLVG